MTSRITRRTSGSSALAWVLLAGSLAANLSSFLTGERAVPRMLRQMAEPERLEVPEPRLTDWVNWVTGAAAFLAGVVCLVIFAVLNI